MAARVLHGVPDSAQVWKIGDKTMIVFVVPNSKPPIYMSWGVSTVADKEAIFGKDKIKDLKYDRTITLDDWKKLGGLHFGNTDQLSDISENPFAGWAQNMATQARVQPWIMDKDYQVLIARATIEGRPLTDAEIQSTNWWRNTTKEGREWMKLQHGDPRTATARLQDNRVRTIEQLKEAGMERASTAVVNYMADHVTMGLWSVAKFQQQLKAITDPYSGIAIDATLAQYVNPSMGQTQEKELDVTDLVRRWLGPVHGEWTPTQINWWAGKLRNDPDGLTQLTETLKKYRQSLFPQYEDDSLTYEDVAAPWRNYVSSIWGQEADETDPLFAQMIRNNDAGVNGELLRKEGLARGIRKVVQDANRDLIGQTGGTVRRALG